MSSGHNTMPLQTLTTDKRLDEIRWIYWMKLIAGSTVFRIVDVGSKGQGGYSSLERRGGREYEGYT